MKYSLTNHGQTPAYVVALGAVVDILPYPLPTGHPLLVPALITSSLTLHPSAILNGHVVATRLFSQAEIDKILTNNGFRIYLFGMVEYRDILGKLRQTKFCRSVVGDARMASVAKGAGPEVKINFEIARQHNDAT